MTDRLSVEPGNPWHDLNESDRHEVLAWMRSEGIDPYFVRAIELVGEGGCRLEVCRTDEHGRTTVTDDGEYVFHEVLRTLSTPPPHVWPLEGGCP